MDYREETSGWSECSISDFADYVNSQEKYCLEKIIPTSTDNENEGNICSPYDKRKNQNLIVTIDPFELSFYL